MAATVDDFRALLPSFADVASDTITAWLAEAAKLVTPDWGTNENTAQIMLAAHYMSLMSIGPESGAAGLAPLKSFSSGSISMTKDDRLGDWSLTSFGRRFQPMLSGMGGGPRVTGTGDLPWPHGGAQFDA